jgi:hypothetical protein
MERGRTPGFPMGPGGVAASSQTTSYSFIAAQPYRQAPNKGAEPAVGLGDTRAFQTFRRYDPVLVCAPPTLPYTVPAAGRYT